MSTHLLHIHIGPMQVFIASARRTRDLWFGSWLMSELSKAAARGVVEQDGRNKLIFPAEGSDLAPDSDLGVSNKIAAEVVDPEKAAAAAKAALDARYDELIAAASLQNKLDSKAWARAEKQLHNFLEFYWVSYPINGNYRYARTYADALLAARKNSRNFQPVDWKGEKLPKSSLNGRMETVIPPKLDAQTMYKKFHARPGEQLSGVDLLKRLGKAENNDKSRFPSTSHMAVMPLYAQLETVAGNLKVVTAWQKYMKTLPTEVQKQERIAIHEKLHLPILEEMDGGLLFESRLLDFMDKSETAVPKKALNTFLKAADISDPNPYYALLVGDGDGMGKAINGMKTAVTHRAFSQKLAAFSQEAKTIIEREDGAIVYTGGDDVLAILPLHKAVRAASALARSFQSRMNGRTFSAGIAIVHHLEPLEDALTLARKAEQEAKAYKKEDGSEKDAVAIILNKRSGAPRMVVGRWGEIDERLAQFAEYYKKNALPHGLAYQLRDMFLHLGGQTAVEEDIKNDGVLRDVMTKEAERIINRKDGDEKAAAYVAKVIAALDHKKSTIETLSSELIIAAHIAAVQEETT